MSLFLGLLRIGTSGGQALRLFISSFLFLFILLLNSVFLLFLYLNTSLCFLDFQLNLFLPLPLTFLLNFWLLFFRHITFNLFCLWFLLSQLFIFFGQLNSRLLFTFSTTWKECIYIYDIFKETPLSFLLNFLWILLELLLCRA